MKKLIIYPYKIGSESAKTLADAFATRRVHPDGKYVPKKRHVILNWGNSTDPNWLHEAKIKNIRILNKPGAVGLAANKIKTFQSLEDAGVSTVPFTTLKEDAVDWSEDDKVLCRTVLTGHSGEGIVIATKPEEIVPAPLYTLYVKKKDEFRIHVFGNGVIDFAAKRARIGEEPSNKYIRSNSNGWVFCREDVVLPEEAGEEAIRAIKALGLDFGAVDLVISKEDGLPYVLEVNTAVGMEGTTVEKYKEAIRPYLLGV